MKSEYEQKINVASKCCCCKTLQKWHENLLRLTPKVSSRLASNNSWNSVMETCFATTIATATTLSAVTVSSCAQYGCNLLLIWQKPQRQQQVTWGGTVKNSRRQTERDLSALKLSYTSHSFVNCPKVAPFGVEILIEIRHQLCELSVRGGHQASQQINFIVSVSLPLPFPLSFYIIYMTWPMATNNFCNWPATTRNEDEDKRRKAVERQRTHTKHFQQWVEL